MLIIYYCEQFKVSNNRNIHHFLPFADFLRNYYLGFILIIFAKIDQSELYIIYIWKSLLTDDELEYSQRQC